MSLSAAIDSATSGLLAQSKALASVSGNVANASTTAYKSTGTSFESYLADAASATSGKGGVLAYSYRSISTQGDIQASDTTSNLAINGDGFFVVSSTADGSDVAYTRNGSFSQNADGYLVNGEGYYLRGWALDADGDLPATGTGSTDSLTAIDLSDVKGTATATSTVAIAANLPADAANGRSVTSTVTLFDETGAGSTMELTWTKDGDTTVLENGTASWDYDLAGTAASVTLSVVDSSGNTVYSTTGGTADGSHTFHWNGVGSDGTASGEGVYTLKVTAVDFAGNAVDADVTGENSWTLTASDPTGDSGTAGTVAGFPITVTFAGDGTLAAPGGDTTFTVSGWTSGAADSTIALDLGGVGGSDGLTQYATGDADPGIEVESVEQDGHAAGTLTGTTIGADGVVTATFSTGETRAIYQVPLATFANADGLDSLSGSVFAESAASGEYELQAAGADGAGGIVPSALESSSVELSDEFSRMIVAQQAYSAASKIVTASDEMLQTGIGLLG
ncbi:flagellar hook protein FlgE [Azospirillum sp. ST 5-10]|uniref:flagellar hook protein FlgE n=1 Tax=unclassified Azospirillum TaxID=2630922 RepID=UPI003F4A038E